MKSKTALLINPEDGAFEDGEETEEENPLLPPQRKKKTPRKKDRKLDQRELVAPIELS